MEEVTKALDLGSGPNPANPFNMDEVYGVDIKYSPLDNVMQADLITEGIPYDDHTFDVVTAFDFVEHVPRLIYINGDRREPFIEFMEEVHRVLKPGGMFYARTPAYPHPEAFQDPGHVNIITPNTVYYFTGEFDAYMPAPWVDMFNLEEQVWDGPWLIWRLRKPNG